MSSQMYWRGASRSPHPGCLGVLRIRAVLGDCHIPARSTLSSSEDLKPKSPEGQEAQIPWAAHKLQLNALHQP